MSPSESEERKANRRSVCGTRSGGIAIGLAIGVVLGIAMHNLGVGIAIGIAFAIALEAAGKPDARRGRHPR